MPATAPPSPTPVPGWFWAPPRALHFWGSCGSCPNCLMDGRDLGVYGDFTWGNSRGDPPHTHCVGGGIQSSLAASRSAALSFSVAGAGTGQGLWWGGLSWAPCLGHWRGSCPGSRASLGTALPVTDPQSQAELGKSSRHGLKRSSYRKFTLTLV